MNATFKSVRMDQMEGAFAQALTTLAGSEAKVAIKLAKDISDGADNLIGQERWELGVVVTVATPDQ